jgi:hypothetical protein
VIAILVFVFASTGCTAAKQWWDENTDNSSHPSVKIEQSFCPIPSANQKKIRQVPKAPDLPDLAMPNSGDFAWSCSGVLYRWDISRATPDGRFRPYPSARPWCRYKAQDGTVVYRQKYPGTKCASKSYAFKTQRPLNDHLAQWYDPTVGMWLAGNGASLVYGETKCNGWQEIDRDYAGGPFYAEANINCRRAHGLYTPPLRDVSHSIDHWAVGTHNTISWSELTDKPTCSDYYQSRACRDTN